MVSCITLFEIQVFRSNLSVCDHSNESYWAVLSCGTVYYPVQGGSIFLVSIVCDHSNESYRAALSCGTVYYAVQGSSNFLVCGWNPSVWPFRWKLLSSSARVRIVSRDRRKPTIIRKFLLYSSVWSFRLKLRSLTSMWHFVSFSALYQNFI